MHTDATLLANYSQHFWDVKSLKLHVVACFCVLLGVVVAQSLKPVKLLATCKRTQQHDWSNNVVSCCVRLHVA